jgi:hypothetical protein
MTNESCRRWLDNVVAAAFLGASLLAGLPAWAGDNGKCRPMPLALWGDGRHDDTKALNAWFRGDNVVWAQTGESVGNKISGRVFKLSAAVYISSGTGRRLEHFEMVWPTHGERVTGGMILAGGDRNTPPVATGISKTGGDPGEGLPVSTPDPTPQATETAGTNCLVS